VGWIVDVRLIIIGALVAVAMSLPDVFYARRRPNA
jgi:hypothetical protein